MNSQWHKFELHSSRIHITNVTIFWSNISFYSFFFNRFVLFCFVLFHSYNRTQQSLNYVHACWIFNIKYWKWMKTTKTIIISTLFSTSKWVHVSLFFPVAGHSFESYRFYSFWIIISNANTNTSKKKATTTTNFSITWELRDFLETKTPRPIDFSFVHFRWGSSILGQQQWTKEIFFSGEITHVNIN